MGKTTQLEQDLAAHLQKVHVEIKDNELPAENVVYSSKKVNDLLESAVKKEEGSVDCEDFGGCTYLSAETSSDFVTPKVIHGLRGNFHDEFAQGLKIKSFVPFAFAHIKDNQGLVQLKLSDKANILKEGDVAIIERSSNAAYNGMYSVQSVEDKDSITLHAQFQGDANGSGCRPQYFQNVSGKAHLANFDVMLSLSAAEETRFTFQYFLGGDAAFVRKPSTMEYTLPGGGKPHHVSFSAKAKLYNGHKIGLIVRSDKVGKVQIHHATYMI